jgi:hypothetical protein
MPAVDGNKIDLTSAGVDKITGVEMPNAKSDVNIVGISSEAFKISGNIKVLESYDSPVISVKKLVLFEGVAKDSKIKKEYTKFNDKGLIVEKETEITEPIKQDKKDNSIFTLLILISSILTNIVIVGFVVWKGIKKGMELYKKYRGSK